MIDEIVIQAAKVVPRERVKNMSVPFALLYSELVKAKEIKPLNELNLDEKKKYWAEADGDTKFRKIIQCQALYVYDLITS
jgi:hypothetical protein